MDLMAWLALAIFAATIGVVIIGRIDSSVAALLGVAAMVWVGAMSEVDAFLAVDWNVMAILISIWIIAGYFGKTGVPEWLSVQTFYDACQAPYFIFFMLPGASSVEQYWPGGSFHHKVYDLSTLQR